MWKCPTCDRRFSNANQAHSCEVFDEAYHFANKPGEVKDIYLEISKQLIHFENIRISYVKNAITFAGDATFLAIKPKKKCLEIEFLLDETIIDASIYKTINLSAKRIAHYVRVKHKQDVNKQLIGWIKRAYEIVNAKV